MPHRHLAVVVALSAVVLGGISVSPSAKGTAGAGPTSSRRFKDDITYVTPTELEHLKDALVKVRLATFRYKQGDKSRHLGFIIEDSPDIPASDMARSQVDLYAYASMAVAALQVQARQIEQLEADVDSLSNEVEGLTGRRRYSALTCPSSSAGSPAPGCR